MSDFVLSCPAPITTADTVQMAHGSGGTMMHRLLESVFLPAFGNPALDAQHDGAALNIHGERLAFTTDSFVVHPLFFPGGDIGTLAVNGTVNDLAMCGAYPRYLSAGFILGGRRFSLDEEPGPSPTKCYDFTKRIIDPNDPDQMRTVFRYPTALRKCPGFSASVAGGLRLDGTVYPLAWLNMGALRGLGIGGTFDYFFWPASRVCNKNADGMCVTQGTELETRQLRLEIGLRWMWNILNKRSRPSLLLSLMYGYHQFSVQKEQACYDQASGAKTACTTVGALQGVDDHGLPDLRYQYIDLGIGGRVPLVASEKWFLGMLLDFHFHGMVDYGEIQTRFLNNDPNDPAALYQGGGYGPVSGGYGLRLGFTPVEFVWKGLTARLSGYYEHFAMSFDLGNTDKGNPLGQVDRPAEAAARHLAQGATDQYFGGVLQLGYQY